jgi:glycopeptide antibiotics resistance protein
MWLPLWILWSIAILRVGILPLADFVGHSHWEYLEWIPTRAQLHSPRFLLDVVGNILLFLPFGLFGARCLAGGKSSGLLRLLLPALVLSCSIELHEI